MQYKHSRSTNQKVNSRSSTEAELIVMDDVIAKVLWTKLFLEAQGYKINKILFFAKTKALWNCSKMEKQALVKALGILTLISSHFQSKWK